MVKNRKIRVENLSNLRRFLTKILNEVKSEQEQNYEKVKSIVSVARLIKDLMNNEIVLKQQLPAEVETEITEKEYNDLIDKLKRMLE